MTTTAARLCRDEFRRVPAGQLRAGHVFLTTTVERDRDVLQVIAKVTPLPPTDRGMRLYEVECADGEKLRLNEYMDLHVRMLHASPVEVSRGYTVLEYDGGALCRTTGACSHENAMYLFANMRNQYPQRKYELVETVLQRRLVISEFDRAAERTYTEGRLVSFSDTEYVIDSVPGVGTLILPYDKVGGHMTPHVGQLIGLEMRGTELVRAFMTANSVKEAAVT